MSCPAGLRPGIGVHLRRATLAVLLALECLGPTRAIAADWIKLTAPNCTVISEVSEARTRAWAVEFELFQRGIAQLLPVDPRNLQPVSVVLFSSDRRFAPFKPVEQGKPARVGGYFLRSPGKNLIALSVDGARDDTRERIFHEATHWHLSAANAELPLWMDEGLAEIFATFTLHGNEFMVGAGRPGYYQYLRAAKRLPFAQLAVVRRGSLSYNGAHADQTELFYVQSWATAHLVMLGQGVASLTSLQRFLNRPAGDEDAVREFTTAFGRSAAQIDADLEAYLARKNILLFKMPLDRRQRDANFSVTAATAGEVDLALGDLLLGVGRPTEAAPNFARAMAALPEDPRPRARLGEVEWSAGHVREALTRFRESFARGGHSFEAYYFSAIARLRELERPMAADAVRSEYAGVTANLSAALRVSPRFRPGYELAGILLAFAPAPEVGKLEALVKEGAFRYPESPGIQLGLGFVAAKNGNLVLARSLAKRAALNASSASFPIANAAKKLDEMIAQAESAQVK